MLRQFISPALLGLLVTAAFAPVLGFCEEPSKPKIGIMKFNVSEGLAPSVGTFLYDSLLTSAVNSGKYTVVDWEEIDRILKYLATSQPNLSPDEARKQAISQLGISKMFVGSVVKLGTKFQVTVKVLKLDLTVESAVTESSTGEEDLPKAVERIAQKLTGTAPAEAKAAGPAPATEQPASPPASSSPTAATVAISGQVVKVWLEENREEGGQACVKVHAQLRSQGMKGDSVEVAAYFFAEDGSPLPDANGKFRSSRGQVYVGQTLPVSSDPSEWADVPLVMPYRELDLTKAGTQRLKVNVVLWTVKGARLGGSDFVSFSYTENEPRVAAAAERSSTPERPGEPRAGETRSFAGIEYVWIPSGRFEMGSSMSSSQVASTYGGEEKWYRDAVPVHSVTIARGFWLGKYEVTQLQWEPLMGSNPSQFRGSNLPVDTVSWEDCQEFIRRLNAKGEGTVRLPSEAEWEYACRAGSKSEFCFGDDKDNLCQYGNYCDLSNSNNLDWQDKTRSDGHDKAAPVGSFKPNAWGLYDMHGNVWEWCQDWYHDSYSGAPSDGSSWESPTGQFRVLRGGSWLDQPGSCRSANRNYNTPDVRGNLNGFRLLRTP